MLILCFAMSPPPLWMFPFFACFLGMAGSVMNSYLFDSQEWITDFGSRSTMVIRNGFPGFLALSWFFLIHCCRFGAFSDDWVGLPDGGVTFFLFKLMDLSPLMGLLSRPFCKALAVNHLPWQLLWMHFWGIVAVFFESFSPVICSIFIEKHHYDAGKQIANPLYYIYLVCHFHVADKTQRVAAI